MQDIHIFIVVFGTVMFAELGDKSQLAVVSMISKSKTPYVTLFGIFSGLTLVTIFSVLIGGLIEQFIPLGLIQFFAGTLFIIFGLFSMKSLQMRDNKNAKTDLDDPHNQIPDTKVSRVQSLSRAFTVIILLELGDKTQIVLTFMSATFSNWLVVFLGGIIALFLVNMIGVILGYQLGSRLPQSTIERVSVILFIILGIWILAEPLLHVLSISNV